MLTANKGEWSEIYAFLRILGDGVLNAGDEQLRPIADLFYPIIAILREEEKGRVLAYEPHPQQREVVIKASGGEELLRLSSQQFVAQAEALLQAIYAGKNAFSVAATERFMQQILMQKIKMPAQQKVDICIVLHDVRTQLSKKMGFSIKSHLGGNSTLLNASGATNITYRIGSSAPLKACDIERINAIDTRSKIVDRYRALRNLGAWLEFDHIDGAAFQYNLSMLDSCMPRLVAQLLMAQLETGESRLALIAEHLEKQDPLGLGSTEEQPLYAYKIKHLLVSVGLGLMPNKPWKGRFEANGGYIIVCEDGQLLCYPFYDRNRMEDYLLATAYLERASTTRHKYGTIERSAGGETWMFRLNLQVRLMSRL